ncbi:peptidase [Mycena galopus ATCC 62051]|nr:peptidase [Mycena galopus ATCC 62051]
MRILLPCALTLVTSVAARSGQTPLSVPGLHLDLDELRLVQCSLDTEAEWITVGQKLQAKAIGRDYIDITETPSLGTISQKLHFRYPSPNSTIVAGVLSHLSTVEPKSNRKHLSSYHTRYYDSESGRESSEWIKAQISAYTTEFSSEQQRSLISIESVEHTEWKQNSIIVRISSPNALDSDPITVIGAHIDSINKDDPFSRAPGADDNGSGSVAILETYRGLLAAGYVPRSPLEFHFYAAEEGGLLGSQAIASSYETAGKSIRGMLQIDTVAFHKAGTREEIGVITNEFQVDAALTEYLILLIDRYLDIPWVKTVYPSNSGGPSPSSDHVSWTRAGYQSCHSIAGKIGNMNPNLHTTDDRIDISPEFLFEHLLQFAKLAVAFTVELSSY